MATLKQHLGLIGLLAIFLLLTLSTSIIVPLTQGEDELAHYRYLKFIAETGHLPTNPAERAQAWYRSDWPPLYHLLVGLAVSPLDTTQPHLKDVGESPHRRLVGEIFYPRLIIYTADATWPWQDGILAWHMGRFISIIFATFALIITYLTAYQIARRTLGGTAKDNRLFALLTTALLAFIPRFIFTSAMLSDDSLFILLSALIIWLLLRIGWGQDNLWLYALCGLLVGLSITTKYSTGLLPFAILPVVWWRKRETAASWWQAMQRVAVNWIATIIGTSWWFGWIIYYFNTVAQDGYFFGLLHPLLASGPDVSMRRIFALFSGESFNGQIRPDAVAPGTIGGWAVYLFETFWGVPILEHDPFFPIFYLLIFIMGIFAMVGLRQLWRRSDAPTRRTLTLLLTIVMLLLPFPILRFFLTYNILETGQGRHILYPAAQTIPLLLMLGWATLLNRQPSANEQPLTISQARQPIILSVPILFLLTWSCLQLGLMITRYPEPLPIQTTTFDTSTIPHPLKHEFSDSIRLLGYDLHPDHQQGALVVTLYWQATDIIAENYLIQLDLMDETGAETLTWQSHPLNGRYPMRAWDAQDVIIDSHTIPLTTLPSGDYRMQLHLISESDPTACFNVDVCPRLNLTNVDWIAIPPQRPSTPIGELLNYHLWAEPQPARQHQTIALSWETHMPATIEWQLVSADKEYYPPTVINQNMVLFTVDPAWRSGDYQLELTAKLTDTHNQPTLILQTEPILSIATDPRRFYQPPPPEGWHPLNANFGDQLQLNGYSLRHNRFQPGEVIPLTLSWQSLAPALDDSITFAVLLNEKQAPYGQVDRYPREFYSPMLWVEGEVVEDNFSLPIQPDAPAGIYTIHLGQYTNHQGQPDYLPLFHEGQPTEQTAVVIGPLKIGETPAYDFVTSPADITPQVTINQTLGQQISLLGYDTALTTDTVRLTLYWQAETIPSADYTTFLHVRDEANQTVAQQDQPPAQGQYPTSLWSVGEVIINDLHVPLSQLPSGVYTPVVGLYNPSNGQRLPHPDNPAQEIPLQPITLP